MAPWYAKSRRGSKTLDDVCGNDKWSERICFADGVTVHGAIGWKNHESHESHELRGRGGENVQKGERPACLFTSFLPCPFSSYIRVIRAIRGFFFFQSVNGYLTRRCQSARYANALPAARLPPESRISCPLSTRVVPLKVFWPLSRCVPVPSFWRSPVPLTTPLKLPLPLSIPTTSCAVPNCTWPSPASESIVSLLLARSSRPGAWPQVRLPM